MNHFYSADVQIYIFRPAEHHRHRQRLSTEGLKHCLLWLFIEFVDSITKSCCHLCASGEQAEAGPGLYEAGAAVQRTRL